MLIVVHGSLSRSKTISITLEVSQHVAYRSARVIMEFCSGNMDA
jgi:hypothetical protein